MAGTLLPAFGLLPAVGGLGLSLQPWRELFATPGLGHAVLLTLATGFAATLLSLLLSAGLCAVAYGSPAFRLAQNALPPLLATPHAALAIGFAFLVAPSGWLLRLLSPWATGLDRPPDWPLLHDPLGVAMTLGLVLKEAPYLLLMTLAALNQVPAASSLRAARALGYASARAWFTVAFPQLYPQIRVPIYAVLAFSLSVVDVALILGPTKPPPLAVLVLRDFSDPDIARWFPACAGAVLLLGLVIAAIGTWRLGELAAAWLLRRAVASGRRGGPMLGSALASAGFWLALLGGLLSIALLGVWSIAGLWRFPDPWPAGWTLRTWRGHLESVAGPASASLLIALVVTTLAAALVLAWLEAADRGGRAIARGAMLLITLPLLVPQIAFLFGLQIALDRAGIDGSWGAVVAAHLPFVLPYLFLSLCDPWQAMDRRYARAAAALGAGPWRVFWTVKLALMLRPLLIAAAVGIAVSIGLYLPTLFAGAGRVATLTTEAVTLAGSDDRRTLGVYATLQSLIPLVGYAVAVLLPRVLYRHRRGMLV